MYISHNELQPDPSDHNKVTDFLSNPKAPFASDMDISDAFLSLTRELQRFYPIDKGLLIIREQDSIRFVVTTSFSEKKTRKNLQLRLPSVSSLFNKVADGGIVYTESCAEFFSGNSFERRLLMDGASQSFVLQPLKHEGVVVGIIGYSSQKPTAFTVFETGLLDNISEQLAAKIVASPAVQSG